MAKQVVNTITWIAIDDTEGYTDVFQVGVDGVERILDRADVILVYSEGKVKNEITLEVFRKEKLYSFKMGIGSEEIDIPDEAPGPNLKIVTDDTEVQE